MYWTERMRTAPTRIMSVPWRQHITNSDLPGYLYNEQVTPRQCHFGCFVQHYFSSNSITVRAVIHGSDIRQVKRTLQFRSDVLVLQAKRMLSIPIFDVIGHLS